MTTISGNTAAIAGLPQAAPAVVGGGTISRTDTAQSLLGDTVLGGNYQGSPFSIQSPVGGGTSPAATGGGATVVGGGGGVGGSALSDALVSGGVGGANAGTLGAGALLETPTGTGGLIQEPAATPATTAPAGSSAPGGVVGGGDVVGDPGVEILPGRPGGGSISSGHLSAPVAGAGAAAPAGAAAGAAQVKPAGGAVKPKPKPKPKTKVITVKQGDTLAELAKRHGTTIAKLEQLNDVKRGTKLKAGRKLKVPA